MICVGTGRHSYIAFKHRYVLNKCTKPLCAPTPTSWGRSDQKSAEIKVFPAQAPETPAQGQDRTKRTKCTKSGLKWPQTQDGLQIETNLPVPALPQSAWNPSGPFPGPPQSLPESPWPARRSSHDRAARNTRGARNPGNPSKKNFFCIKKNFPQKSKKTF